MLILPKRYKYAGNSNGGGMGDIIECIDTHLKRRVVLKMLKDGEENRRLLDEQKALLRLRSKHVVQLYDIITVSVNSIKKKALILEHIEGKDLGVGTITPGEEHLYTLWQIACGLVDIHHENIIHRDIKHNNIRINNDKIIKILDFGLSRSVGINATTMNIIGTPGYMAPELWMNNNVSFDKAIDVYAFGVLALTLISGGIPKELIQCPPIPPVEGEISKYLKDLPDIVIDVLESCLKSDPKKRPTIVFVEEVLRRHLLYNKHRALLVLGGQTYEINATTKSVNVKSGVLGSISINYDGYQFIVSALSGLVLVNNMSINVGDEIPGCCVIAFGSRDRARSFVTFDVSYPEVMP